MKKYLVKLGLVGTLTFLVFFVYFYKTSGKFRQSIISAVVALTVLFSSQQAAHSINKAEGFTQRHPQHQSRPRDDGFFSRKSNNDGPGPGKPDGDGSDDDDGGIPKYPKPESVEETQRRLSNMDKQIKKLEEVTDSDSETEKNTCSLKSKAGLKGLPDGKNFVYDMDQGRGLKKLAKRVWKNSEAKKEVLRMLSRFDDENANIQEKAIQGFNDLTELKNSGSGVRIIIYNGKDKSEPPAVIVICMRDDLEEALKKLETKYS